MGDLLGSPRVASPSTCLGLKGYVVVVMIHCVARHSYSMIQTYSTRLITMLNLNIVKRILLYWHTGWLYTLPYCSSLYSLYRYTLLVLFIISSFTLFFGTVYHYHSWPKCSLLFADMFVTSFSCFMVVTVKKIPVYWLVVCEPDFYGYSVLKKNIRFLGKSHYLIGWLWPHL